MPNESLFLKVDLPKWMAGAIKKYEAGEDWNSAWTRTYAELGGDSVESGKKGCPMAAARTLYELGHLVGYGRHVRLLSLKQIASEYSKNGAYAVATIQCMREDPTLNIRDLWSAVQRKFRAETCEEPAKSNQGGPTLTFKLWKLGLLQ